MKTDEEKMNDRHQKEAKNLMDGISTLKKTADLAIGNTFDDIKAQFNNPKDYKKWQEISSRLLIATINRDTKTVESLKKDLSNLVDSTNKEKDNNVE